MQANSSDSPSTLSTSDRLLEVAERLFAEKGYSGVSLRSITAAADANMAAVHYYFRSKQGLLQAIFERRAAALTAVRMKALDAALEEAGDGKPDVRKLLAAFVGPGVELAGSPEGETFNRLSAICSVDPDPDVRAIVFGVHDAVARTFTDALRRACPDIDATAFFVKLQCIFGSMMYIRTDNGRVDRLVPADEAMAAKADRAASLEHLLDFLAAGVEATPRRPSP
jgi:Transcriptional regulator